ncbi:hypothetical protein WN943_023205 [Citrus x changshan-huyou]
MAMDYEIKFIQSYQSVNDCELAQATAMKTDLYNSLDVERRSMMLETDSKSALAYLKGKADMDPSFFCKYIVDKENRLANLFWAIAHLDYHFFGDVLAFGTLRVDETIETYMWVLEMFLSTMNDKKPISMVTDGDRAIRKAIKKIRKEAQIMVSTCVIVLDRQVYQLTKFGQVDKRRSVVPYIFYEIPDSLFNRSWGKDAKVGKEGDEKQKSIAIHEVSSNASFDINLENEPSDKDVVEEKLQDEDEFFLLINR